MRISYLTPLPLSLQLFAEFFEALGPDDALSVLGGSLVAHFDALLGQEASAAAASASSSSNAREAMLRELLLVGLLQWAERLVSRTHAGRVQTLVNRVHSLLSLSTSLSIFVCGNQVFARIQ